MSATSEPTKEAVFSSMLAITTGFVVLYFIFHHHWMLTVAAVVGGIGLLLPALARLIHQGWMKLAMALGWFNGRVLISAVFFLLLTPIALLRRLGKSDALKLKAQRGASLWTVRDHIYAPQDLEKPW